MAIPFSFLPTEPTTNWELITRTSPDRIVNALKSGAKDPPTVVSAPVGFCFCPCFCPCFFLSRPKLPDQDFIYILVAVRDRASKRDIHWSRLVDAGAVDALCECVLHAKTRPLDPISGSRLRIETSVSIHMALHLID
jgi:hypothetical protein